MVVCAESVYAAYSHEQEMEQLNFSMADELFGPRVSVKNQARRPSSQLNWSVQTNRATVAGKKEKYAYKSIGVGMSTGGQIVASSGRVNESVYLAQRPEMGTWDLEEFSMSEMMFRASPPPGGGHGTGELVPLDDEIPILLLLLLGYCLWLGVRKPCHLIRKAIGKLKSYCNMRFVHLY